MKTMLAGMTIGLLLLLAGCATMTSGGTQQLTFQSVPDDVVVTLVRDVMNPESHWEKKSGSAKPTPKIQETRILGKTPFTLQMDRAEGQSVTFSKEGYTSLTMSLTTHTNPAVWGNIFFGGVFGTTTDSASGAMYEYVPNQYMVTLNPVQAGLLELGTGRTARDQARLFIVRRYDALMSDLSRGRGEDLSALMILLRVEHTHQASAQDALSMLASRYLDVAEFATHAAGRYIQE